jgi:hypothetical protein
VAGVEAARWHALRARLRVRAQPREWGGTHGNTTRPRDLDSKKVGEAGQGRRRTRSRHRQSVGPARPFFFLGDGSGAPCRRVGVCPLRPTGFGRCARGRCCARRLAGAHMAAVAESPGGAGAADGKTALVVTFVYNALQKRARGDVADYQHMIQELGSSSSRSALKRWLRGLTQSASLIRPGCVARGRRGGGARRHAQHGVRADRVDVHIGTSCWWTRCCGCRGRTRRCPL